MTNRSPADSEQLAAAVVAGDRAAWTRLYYLWTPRIYGYFRVRLQDDLVAAEDLVQETMIEVWRSLEIRQTAPREFRPWIFRIAHNRWVRYFKARKPEQSAGLAMDTFNPGDFAIGALRAVEMRQDWPWFIDLLNDAIESMPEYYREVLRTSLATDATGADLADLLGLSAEDATKWRSEGTKMFFNAAAVTLMARGTAGTPCRGFTRQLTRAGWSDGPLGESLREKLARHVGKCQACQEHRTTLKKTLELTPVFVPVLVPSSVFAAIAAATDPDEQGDDRNQKRQTAATAAPILAAVTKKDQPPAPPVKKSPVGGAIDAIGNFFGVLVMIGLTITLLQKFAPEFFEKLPSTRPATVRLDMSVDAGTRVHVAPLGTTCSPVAGTCSSRLRPGTQVTLTAEPSEYTEGALTWMGCPTGPDARYPCTFVMTSNVTICLFEAPYDGGPPLAWCRGQR
ncbi:RNA polymerase sigma factor [Nocardia suismassiliense]|uniref:RNA polymerase sigma factor n=1 Tax=Nocardia suismassiliense TaxID=2077092 RepID=UPI00131EED31|nr:RNA polymerase sigma factor [Nocardia suismassiliense]